MNAWAWFFQARTTPFGPKAERGSKTTVCSAIRVHVRFGLPDLQENQNQGLRKGRPVDQFYAEIETDPLGGICTSF